MNFNLKQNKTDRARRSGIKQLQSYSCIRHNHIFCIKNNSQLQTTELWEVAMCSSLQMHIRSFIISTTQSTVSRNCPLRIWFSTKFSGSAIILCTQGNAVINVHFSYFNLWAPHVYWFCRKTKCQAPNVVLYKCIADLSFLYVDTACGLMSYLY